MFVEASVKGLGHNAILTSPSYHGLGEQCVEFYYHMYGHHVGTLNVYTKVLKANQRYIPSSLSTFLSIYNTFSDF